MVSAVARRENGSNRSALGFENMLIFDVVVFGDFVELVSIE